jgi:hypothetical protein
MCVINVAKMVFVVRARVKLRLVKCVGWIVCVCVCVCMLVLLVVRGNALIPSFIPLAFRKLSVSTYAVKRSVVGHFFFFFHVYLNFYGIIPKLHLH